MFTQTRLNVTLVYIACSLVAIPCTGYDVSLTEVSVWFIQAYRMRMYLEN
jgi:hypothetical protein